MSILLEATLGTVAIILVAVVLVVLVIIGQELLEARVREARRARSEDPSSEDGIQSFPTLLDDHFASPDLPDLPELPEFLQHISPSTLHIPSSPYAMPMPLQPFLAGYPEHPVLPLAITPPTEEQTPSGQPTNLVLEGPAYDQQVLQVGTVWMSIEQYWLYLEWSNKYAINPLAFLDVLIIMLSSPEVGEW